MDFLLSIAGHYYGIDWIAMTSSFLQLYLLGNKNRSAFLFGIAANIAWLLFGLLAGSGAQILANLVFLTMNIRGYILWQKNVTIHHHEI